MAYDLATCNLYEGWIGSVAFGESDNLSCSVPLPERCGIVFSEGVDGQAWVLLQGGELKEAHVLYRGCEFRREAVTLVYSLSLPTGSVVRIEETPELMSIPEMNELWQQWVDDPDSEWDANLIGLRRSFSVTGNLEGIQLALRWNRRQDAMTSWGGFEAKRDPTPPMRSESRVINGESMLLVFTEGLAGGTLEIINPSRRK